MGLRFNKPWPQHVRTSGRRYVAIPLLRDLLRKPGDASLTTALLRADPI